VNGRNNKENYSCCWYFYFFLFLSDNVLLLHKNFYLAYWLTSEINITSGTLNYNHSFSYLIKVKG